MADVTFIEACSPGEFVGYIKNADYVVTNSFHATAISIQMERDFYCVKCRNPKRVKNILSALDLEGRYVSSHDEINISDTINYDIVKKTLKELGRRAVKFLNTEISCNHDN